MVPLSSSSGRLRKSHASRYPHEPSLIFVILIISHHHPPPPLSPMPCLLSTGRHRRRHATGGSCPSAAGASPLQGGRRGDACAFVGGSSCAARHRAGRIFNFAVVETEFSHDMLQKAEQQEFKRCGVDVQCSGGPLVLTLQLLVEVPLQQCPCSAHIY